MVVSPLPDAYPVAVGTALAAKLDGTDRVALANCGEGATATGTWHEAMNFAATMHLPIVFTVQNNQFAYSTPNPHETALEGFADRAAGYGIPGVRVDGNDLLACYDAASSAIDRARSGGGPTLIEAVTFRHFGHAGHDAASYVPEDDRAAWMAKDPIPRFEAVLYERGILDDDQRAEIEEATKQRVVDALAAADDHPDPDPTTVGDGVFAVRTNLPQPDITDGEVAGTELTLLDAIRTTLGTEMDRDDRIILLGEDVGAYGGAFKVTEGLYERFGPDRVIDTPISEMALVGAGVGAALYGRRPIIEFQYTDFMYPGLDQLVNEAAKYHWKTGHAVPMVLRAPSGAGLRAGPNHSISPEGLLAHHPGIKVVCPSNPVDAKGLLLAAIRDPNPVYFLEHKKLYRSVRATVPDVDYEVPIGSAAVVKPGTDISVITWGAMVATSREAADTLASEGVSVEIVDLRSLSPIDWDTVFASVSKTGRVVIVQEDSPIASVASEVGTRIAEDLFWSLDAPIRRVTPPHTHIPFAPVLEDAYLPQAVDIVAAVRDLAGT
ncbi:MAG: dehydrogenase E1 component subunit alpha/beta, partial [Acidimicrobiia bacterium]|nr:dehydrogenase E1 component subunit alpha/beta [Acidimicrobiia bacterium]